MNISTRLFLGLFLSALSLNSSPVFADYPSRTCRLDNSYGYLYNGTNHTQAGPVAMTQTGVFSVDRSGNLNGEGTIAFQFSNFAGKGPLWLLLREVQSNGVVMADAKNPCIGIAEFLATMTVIKTSNSSMVPVGTVLIANAPRSMAYTISGRRNEMINLISTSPGTIASGVAHKQNQE